MVVISVRESGRTEQGFQIRLGFDGGGEYPLMVQDPIETGEEQLWEWYFEEHLQHPLVDQVRAGQVAERVRAYGERLFEQVFRQDPDVYAEYVGIRGRLDQVRIEIVGDGPEFQAWHWEAMWDPGWPRPLGVECEILRKRVKPAQGRIALGESPVIQLLVVTARPGGDRDVAYRTISRPLVEAIDAAQLRVKVELLRPGTYEALARHLEDRKNHYHLIHFDTHGSLATFEQLQSIESEEGAEALRRQEPVVFKQRYGRGEISPYEGMKAFLWLEDDQGRWDPVEAGELADLLMGAGIPVCVLNACQSGKQLPQVDERETSLGSRLMAAGMQMVVAMGYSITVSAAQILMGMFYRRVFEGVDLGRALRIGRRELFNNKERRAYFGMTIGLEDWVLPVAYGESRVDLRLREFSAREADEFYGREETRYRFAQPIYGFVGRDLDILKIERGLIKHNVLLVRGMGGTGKTTLLRYLQEWWDRTRFADRIFYFGYDERAWTVDQIVGEIGRLVFDQYDPFQTMGIEAKRGRMGQYLRSENVILILDNVESVTGEALAIPNTLSGEERDRLRGFLARLVGGKGRVILGSRSREEWLQDRTFGDNVHELQGLDGQARTELAEKILQRNVRADRIEGIKGSEGFRRLMKLLAGYPLAMEVVLANLRDQNPDQVLEALDRADVELDRDSEDKTISILKCVEYSHSNLSQGAQDLLVCLAPFNGFIDRVDLSDYGEELKKLDPFREYDFDRFDEAIQEGINWGLLSPMGEDDRLLSIQPVFPYFLRTKVREMDLETQEALGEGFSEHYKGLARSYNQWMESNDPQQRQLGMSFCRLEYENLFEALRICLEGQRYIEPLRNCLDSYFRIGSDPQGNLKLNQYVCEMYESYPEDLKRGSMADAIVVALFQLSTCYLELQDYEAAREGYQKALTSVEDLQGAEEERKQRILATTYHQLGIVAQEQREYEEARRCYLQALEICVAFNDRYSQAGTYHQLGIVAQEQREYEEARRCYLQALEIKVAFNDRYSQASTYHQLGYVAQEQREYEEARRCYLQALEIYVAFNDRYEQAGTYHQLGYVAQEQREYEEARRCYLQALEIYVAFNDRYSQARTYHQLGRVAEEQREYEEARRCYLQALEIYVAFNDRYSQASTYGQLGLLAQAMEDLAEAQTQLIQALEIFVEFGDQHNAGKAFRNLGKLYRSTQDQALVAAVAPIVGLSEAEVRSVFEADLKGSVGG